MHRAGFTVTLEESTICFAMNNHGAARRITPGPRRAEQAKESSERPLVLGGFALHN
jgi:hypothetical protein